MHISGIKERHAEGNRLRHSASVLLALAAALAVLLVGNVDVGQAQTAASLIEVQGGGTQIHFEGERALGFRTAASAGTGNDGWVVTEVELRIRPDDGTGANRTATPPGLAICEATNSGDPDPNGTCFPLTAPGTVQVPTAMTNGQEVTYTATGNGHFLATGTEYTLHFTENRSTNAGDVHYLDASNDDGEAVFVAGAFANVMRELRSDNTWGGSSTSVAWARITGYPSTTPVNSAATGAPSITAPNVFRVPAALGVDLSGIVDTNGVAGIAGSATYKWQRFGADGTTLETDSIGTDSTYTLTDADAGKTLKVVVSFRDDDNFAEGPLTSAATAAITAAATCDAPTLTGGAVFLGPARKVGVEQSTFGGVITYGFASSTNVGSLDNATFTTAASDDYEILTLISVNSELQVRLDTALPAADRMTAVLYVCDQAYAFASAHVVNTSYTSITPAQNWSMHAERTIYLSQDTAAPTLVSATVNGTSLVMTFSEELGAAASLANGDFTVKKGSGGTTQTLSSTAPSISGSTVTLTLATTVSATDTNVKVFYTKPTTGTANKLLDTFGNEVATFTADQDVTNEQDTVAPTFVSATVNGTSLVMTFNEELGAAASLANGAFTVKKGSGGTTQTLSGSPSISGRTVTLTLDTAVSATDTDVKVSYTKPSTGTANKLLDTFGNEVATFTADQDVGNQLADNTPPELVSSNAAVLARDGLTLTLTFNEALKTSSVPAVAAFTVKATPAGATEAVVDLASSGAVTVSGSTVVLKLGIPITHNDGSANVSYAKPGTGAVIEDTNGNDAADFTNRPASNNSAVPRVSIARVHADASPGIAHAEFTVTRSNISASALTVNISITQTDTYLASTTDTITIPANATSKTEKFESYYEGNTSGDLTATVSEGTGYVPAVTPNNAATVRMKVPTSGRTLTISHQQGNYLVTEGDGTVSIGATLTTGDASAEPRETVSLLIDTTDGTAKSGNPSDFVQVAGQIVSVQPGNWTASGTAYTATSSALILIENDNEYEGSEQFNVIIGPDSTHAIFNLVCPPGTQASRGCLATVTITDDETLDVGRGGDDNADGGLLRLSWQYRLHGDSQR